MKIVSAVPAFGTELSGGTGEIPGEKSISGEMLSDGRTAALPEGISGKDSSSGERVVDYESPVVRNRDGMTDILRLPDNSAQGLLRSGASDSAVVKPYGEQGGGGFPYSEDALRNGLSVSGGSHPG